MAFGVYGISSVNDRVGTRLSRGSCTQASRNRALRRCERQCANGEGEGPIARVISLQVGDTCVHNCYCVRQEDLPDTDPPDPEPR